MNKLQSDYFLALAKYKNFTDTAKALYVSQPAISKQIAALEKTIGFTLFFRSNRSVSLTPAGMIFLQAFTEINNLYQQAFKQAEAIYHTQDKKLRLGCLEGMELSNILNQVFTSFSAQFPEIEYYLERHTSIGLLAALNNGDLDATIVTEPFIKNQPDLSHSIFLQSRHLLFISANNPLAKKPFEISNFKNETFISLANKDYANGQENLVEWWCQQNNFTPKKIHYVPNIESLMLSVEVGLGATICDTLFRLRQNPLLLSFELNSFHNIYIVWKKKQPEYFNSLICQTGYRN